MNIPKIIHYCWFGPEDIPEKELKCIKSWSAILPDYELMFWNEDSFDFKLNNFAFQAYKDRAYAFVSDYVRTNVLYEHGGIYLDADVELLKGFDGFLIDDKCLLGFENRSQIGTALMRFTPKHPLIHEFLNYYQHNDFVDSKGNVNTIANVRILNDILKGRGLIADGSCQVLDEIKIYPREYFYPKKISDIDFRIVDETVAIHKFSSSWMSEREKNRGKNIIWINLMRPLLRRLRNFGQKIIGGRHIQSIEVRIRNILK